jgi:hypothetical protein
MVHSCPHKWSQWLPLVEFWYNTTFHSAHGHTPFEALYSYPPKHFGITVTDACVVPDLEEWIQLQHYVKAYPTQSEPSSTTYETPI